MKKLSEIKNDVKAKWGDEDFRREALDRAIFTGSFVFLVWLTVRQAKKAGNLSTYSFGLESPFKIVTTPEAAEAHTRVSKAMVAAQERMAEAGVEWDPEEQPIELIDIRKGDIAMYNTIAKAVNKFIKKNGPVDASGDFLIKN